MRPNEQNFAHTGIGIQKMAPRKASGGETMLNKTHYCRLRAGGISCCIKEKGGGDLTVGIDKSADGVFQRIKA